MSRNPITLALILLLALPGTGCTRDGAKNGPEEAGMNESGPKTILVTGASTGIGRKLTEHLAAAGHVVYATARKDADLQALAAIPNVHAIRLDVTKPEEIDAAVAAVTSGGRGLYALVNNAGIASAVPLLDTSPEEFASLMAVNVTGPYLVSKAFAPLITASKGRIVNIGSISGLLSFPDGGAYEMSKAAIETFSDALAKELAPAGVQVSLVEPGSYNTGIMKSGYERTGQRADLADRSRLKPPDEVVTVTEAALFEHKPKRRYMVVPDKGSADATIRAELEKLVQINEGQPYTFDRAELVKRLDAALEGSRAKQPFETRTK